MLTQEPAPDLKCTLIISTFLTFVHLLDCFICTRNAMSITNDGGMGEVGGGECWVGFDLYQGVGGGQWASIIL